MDKRVNKKNLILSIGLVLIVFVCTIFAAFFPAVVCVKADENTVTYSNVLDDLKADSNFDETTYPAKADDYTLSVITVAESENLQLFVYVYQPSYGSKTLVASSINISTNIYNKLKFTNYKLSLLSQDGVFQKYVVESLIVNSDDVRYYEISSIFRAWDSVVDKGVEPTNDNTIDEVSFSVGKQYKFENISGRIDISVKDIELINITEKYVGFMRYPANTFEFSLGYDSFDVHYIAFSTDRQIDELLEADIFYRSQSCHIDNWSGAEYGNKTEQHAYLNSNEGIEVSGEGWFSTTYNWKAIETGSSFVASEHATYSYDHGIFDSTVMSFMSEENLKTYIASRDWVLRFAVTEYVYWENGKGDHSTKDYTIVGEVSILRLEFKTDGIIYNLGVVDNKQTGALNPDNTTETSIKLDERWQKLVALIGIVIILVLYNIFLAPFVNPIILGIFKLIWKGVWLIIKGVFRIITLPLRFIFRRR